MRFQVVVVGGGPAGALAARAAAEAGAKTLLLERAPKKTACCAGLVSCATAERLRIPKDLMLREIRAVRLFFPGEMMVELRAERTKAVVLDRNALNQWLRGQAQEKGAELRFAAATARTRNHLVTTQGPVEFEVLIGADGACSTIANLTGLPRPQELLTAAQAEIRAELGDAVEVHLGVVPDFFAWAVPAEEGLARVGLATSQGRKALLWLRHFLARRFPRAPLRSLRTGLIPFGPPPETMRERTVLLGNAAAHVKPLTGGGLAFISLCAPLAGALAAQGPGALPGYEAHWRRMIGEEIAFEEKARRVFLSLDQKALVQVGRALADQKLAEFLAEVGDIDCFSALIPKILAHPSLWPPLLPLLRWLPVGEFF